MDEKNKASLKIVATILGNISAISAGIALFEKDNSYIAVFMALVFAGMAVYTIRSVK